MSKIYVIELIQSEEREVFLYDFLNLTLNWNTGIAFGLLSSNANLWYHLVSALILLIIVYLIYLMVISDNSGKIIITSLIIIINLLIIYLIFKSNDLRAYFFILILGGSLGNLFDRLYYSAVPDFIDFHIENFHWFTFNIADIFISLGIFGMVVKEFILKKKI